VKEAEGEARKEIAAATSSAVPTRPRAWQDLAWSKNWNTCNIRVTYQHKHTEQIHRCGTIKHSMILFVYLLNSILSLIKYRIG
jgi:trehalose/maltose hydrolase-like predicted phosphorylase